jgi:hypothetical protein
MLPRPRPEGCGIHQIMQPVNKIDQVRPLLLVYLEISDENDTALEKLKCATFGRFDVELVTIHTA